MNDAWTIDQILRNLRDGDISLGRAMELIAPRVLVWHRGFPPKSGMYLVDLGNREHVVTHYAVPGTEGVDTWGDRRGVGWHCLTGSHATVKAWARVPVSGPVLQSSLHREAIADEPCSEGVTSNNSLPKSPPRGEA